MKKFIIALALLAEVTLVAQLNISSPFFVAGVLKPAAAGGGGGGITFDAVISERVVNAPTGESTSHTITTLSAGYIVVQVCMYDGADADITGMTFDGTAMTEIARHNVDYFGEYRVIIYGLAVGSKTAGTYNAVMSSTSGIDDYNVGVLSYNGVHQSASVGTATDGTGTTSPAAVTVTSATGELVVGCVIKGDKTGSPTGGETERWDTVTGSADTGWGGEETGAASVSFSCTLSADNQWCMTAIPLKPE